MLSTRNRAGMLCAENLSYEINDTIIIRDLSLSVHPGEVLYIEGDNGTGKTILLQILCGMIQPDRGQVRWNNEAITDNIPDYHENLAYIGHLTGVKPALTAGENLRFLSMLSGLPRRQDYRAALAWAGLGGFDHSPAWHLSHGQQRRVALARLRFETAPVWVLDEPFSGLDRRMIESLKRLFMERLEQGGLLILTSHQPLDLAGMKSRRITLNAAE